METKTIKGYEHLQKLEQIRYEIHPSQIQVGMAIEDTMDGQIKFVGKYDIKHDSFMGYVVFGSFYPRKFYRIQYKLPLPLINSFRLIF